MLIIKIKILQNNIIEANVSVVKPLSQGVMLKKPLQPSQYIGSIC